MTTAQSRGTATGAVAAAQAAVRLATRASPIARSKNRPSRRPAARRLARIRPPGSAPDEHEHTRLHRAARDVLRRALPDGDHGADEVLAAGDARGGPPPRLEADQGHA